MFQQWYVCKTERERLTWFLAEAVNHFINSFTWFSELRPGNGLCGWMSPSMQWKRYGQRWDITNFVSYSSTHGCRCPFSWIASHPLDTTEWIRQSNHHRYIASWGAWIYWFSSEKKTIFDSVIPDRPQLQGQTRWATQWEYYELELSNSSKHRNLIIREFL